MIQVDRITDAIGNVLLRFPGTEQTCEDALHALFRWARVIAETLPKDKREAWACRAYQVADHLAAAEE